MPCFNVLGFVLFAALFSRWTNFPALFVLGDSYAGPSFLREPPSHVDFANDTGATLDCSAEGTEPVTISWVTAADNRPVSPIHGVLELLLNGSLLLLPFHASDYRHDVHAATYRCVASNTVGKLVSRDVRVNAVVLQNHELHVEASKDVQIGASAMLRCNTPGFVREFISVTSWIQDSTFNIYPSPRGDGKYHMLASGELIIHQVDESDRYRSYQCRGVNKLTGASLLSVNRGRISLAENMRMLSAAKMFEKHRIINVKKDDSVILPCSAQGNPHPTIKWYKQDSPVEESERIQRIGSCLFISHVEETDSGLWNCVGNNSEGQDKMQLFIQVKSSLSIEMSPSGQVVVDVGHRIELHCRVSPKRLASAKAWLKDGLVLRRNSEEVLVLDRVQREDAGMYQCHVSADDDSAQMSAQVILGASHPQLIYKFIQQTLQPGPPVSLKCIATGNPTPHISWKLDGYPLAGDRFVMGQYMSLHGDVISHVNISSVRVEDSGIYQCTATNRVGSQTHSADMRVYGAPFVRAMGNVSAIAGEPLYLGCPVAGYPIESITWQKGVQQLPLNRRQKVFPNGTLLIENVQKDHDRGIYWCTATNKQGRSSSQNVHISVTVPPHIGPFTFGELMEGVRTQVSCVVQSGDLPLSLQWYRNGLVISQPDITIKSDQYASILSIERVTRNHAGNYTCVATNAAKSTQATAQLVVAVPPHWILTPRSANITRDSTYILNCQADGFPQPTVVWRKLLGKQSNDYQEVSGRGLSVHSNGTIFIKQALPEHAGQYLCEASNGIGADISSSVSIVVLNPPEFDIKSSQLSGKRGAIQTLTCKCRGDSPMTLTWSKENSLPLHYKSRYQTKQFEENGVHQSELVIPNTEKTDAGMYTCTASNPYGRDQSTIHFTVQDAPGQPQDVKLVTSNSRSLKVSWSPPSEESVLQYIVQYRTDSASDLEWKSQNSGTEQWSVLTDLLPATLYRVRVLAENSLGAGRPSESLLVHTEAEPPTGEPTGLHAVAVSSDSIRVTWNAPPPHLTNGDLLGYYLGYREQGFGRQNSYNFTTIPVRSDSTGIATLTGLRKYRKYDIVVQAFNEKGPGPMSSEVSLQTLEDVPAAPPLDITCTPLSSTVLSVTWQPPPLLLQNGEILGYKVYYENMRELPLENIETGVKQSMDTKISLKGLHKYCNYSIHIWAYTRVGEGVRSKPVHCLTAEDVPEAPAGIKVHSNAPLSLMLSWRPPLRSNGVITSYTVYSKSLQVKRLPPTHTHTQLSDLRKGETQEFWVTASTGVGEGPSTDVVKAVVSSKPKYPASIISFGDLISIKSRQSISLRCLSVGSPAPKRTWHKSDARSLFAVQSDGSLEISSIEPAHSGNYTCSVSNSLGTDSITYSLLVLMPPSPVILKLVDKGSSWLDLDWRVENSGGSPIRGFILKFKRSDLSEWNDISLPRDIHNYKLKDLICGKEYDVEVSSYNSVGAGEAVKSVPLQTQGGKPLRPTAHQLIIANTTSFLLDLNTWLDNGCKITSFSIEYREVMRSEWITVGNDLQMREKISIAGLWPGTDYVLRVKASNSAGVTKAEYPVSTSALLIGEVPSNSDFLDSSGVVYSSLLPLTLVLIVILLCILTSLLMYIKKRKRGEILTASGLDSGEDDNKRNLSAREQYYAAALQTTTTTTPVSQGGYEVYENDTTRWDFPVKNNSFQSKNQDDVSPYATFQIANADVRSFIHHEHKLASMDTLPLKSGNVYERDKYKMKVRKSSKSSVPPDYEDWSRQARISVQSAESSTSPEASPRCLRHRTDVSCDSLSHSNFSESDFTNQKRHRRSNHKKYSIAV
uniref:Down syndrome cell adhesion molecule-like protein Dscam2 n=3 Tax=Cacopsylla melanoneura TaxID=428564 RepID=A0A8D8VA62_9HEMI